MIWLLLAGVLIAGAAQEPAPRRDVPAAAPVGTAIVSGIVVTDAEKPAPVRRARVTLSSTSLNVNRTIVTDETGRFTFERVPEGQFSLAAMKEAYVPAAFGARRPGGTGTSLVVEDGGRVTGLTLRLLRGGVITGTISDADGRPLPDANVTVMEQGYVRGQRQLVTRISGRSDDRGVYRIFGLRPGRYVVMAAAQRFSFATAGDLLAPSEADIDRALKSAEPAPPSGRGAQAASIGFGRPVGQAPTYYPNALTPNQAAFVEVAAGRELTGIDLQLQLVSNGSIAGTVTTPDGEPPALAQVTATAIGEGAAGGFDGFRSGRVNQDGTFQFGSVPPGDYLVTARLNRPGGPQAAVAAMERISVNADAATNVSLQLRPGLTISGRVDFEGATTAPPNPRGWRLSIAPVQPMNGMITLGNGSAEVKPDGTFTITGVMPGSYRLQAGAAPAGGDRWTPKGMMANGRNVLEGPLDVHGEIDDVVVTYTDRVAQISGKLQDAGGAPASDYYVIVFPKDPQLWTSFRIRTFAVRPSTDGTYAVRQLPPGEYFITAVLDVEQGEWLDPAFLQRLVSTSLAVTIAEGEHKVQDLKLGTR